MTKFQVSKVLGITEAFFSFFLLIIHVHHYHPLHCLINAIHGAPCSELTLRSLVHFSVILSPKKPLAAFMAGIDAEAQR